MAMIDYFVYELYVENKKVYVGMTNDPIRRSKEHEIGIIKDKKKYLYRVIRNTYLQMPKINLKIVKKFNNIVDAERYEAYLILMDYFSEKRLLQSPPHNFRYY